MQQDPTVRRVNRWVVAALLVAACFWGRLLVSAASLDPAREVRFFDANGPVPEPSCHGPAVVDGPYLWQVCGQSLARFELAKGRADLLWPAERIFYVSAFTKDSSGAPLVVLDPTAPTALYRVRAEGGLQALKTFELPVVAVVAAADRIEVVSGFDRKTLHTLANGAWAERAFPVLEATDGQWIHGAGAEKRDGVWRVVHLRGPRKGSLPVDAEVMVSRDFAPFEKVSTVTLDAGHATVVESGEIYPHFKLFHLPGSNELNALSLATTAGAPYEWVGDKAVPLAPPFTGYIEAYDAVHTSAGNATVVQIRGPLKATRIRGEWFTAGGGRRLQLTRTRDGRTTTPVDSFWVNVGYKLLPAESSGYWLVGGLGSAYARVGPELERLDRPSFLERMAGLFRRDRAKRNSDIYRRGSAVVEKVAVGWTLFGPFAVLAAALVSLRRPSARATAWATYVSAAWLATMVVCAWSAWKILGFF